jgi:hypothetical protein
VTNPKEPLDQTVVLLHGPAAEQLGTCRDQNLQALLGFVDYPVGVIAGDRTIDPMSWLIIPGPNDGRVSVARTVVPGVTDQITVHATHALMMRNEDVIRQATAFLKEGRFLPRSLGETSPHPV